jgi:hypothetical protein
MMAPNGSLDLMFGRGRASNSFSSSPPPQSAGLKAISQFAAVVVNLMCAARKRFRMARCGLVPAIGGAYLGACSTAGTCRRLRNKPQLIGADTLIFDTLWAGVE